MTYAEDQTNPAYHGMPDHSWLESLSQMDCARHSIGRHSRLLLWTGNPTLQLGQTCHKAEDHVRIELDVALRHPTDGRTLKFLRRESLLVYETRLTLRVSQQDIATAFRPPGETSLWLRGALNHWIAQLTWRTE